MTDQPDKAQRRRAFDTLDDRCRPCLRELTTAMNLSDEDAEDVVQDALFGLFLGGETFRNFPEDLIDGLAVDSVLACVHAARRRARLRSALADANVSTRAEREGRGAFWLRSAAM